MLYAVKPPVFCIQTAIALPLVSMVTAGATASPRLDSISSAAPQEFELAVYRPPPVVANSGQTALALPGGSPATLGEEMLSDNPSEICRGVLHVPSAPAVAAQTLMVPAGTPSCCRHTATGMPDWPSAISTSKASESVCSTSTGGSQVPNKD